MAQVQLFAQLATRRAAQWAHYPDAPRGYLAGEQDPDAAAGVGLVTLNSVPGIAHVVVRHRQSGVAVASTISTSGGTWRVSDLPSLDEYDIIARDPSATWEDVIIGGQFPYVAP